MKNLSAGMLAALDEEVTQLVTCWYVERTDGTQYFFTDNDQNLTIDGNVYKAATGMSASAVATGSDLAVDNLEVSGALNSVSITDADLLNGKWDFAYIQIFQVNRLNLADGKLILHTGTIGQVKSMRNTYRAELRGLCQSLQQMFGRNVTPGCDADLGDARCQVNMAGQSEGGEDLTQSTTVTSSSNKYSFIASALIGVLAEGDTEFFVGGTVTFTSGANNGAVREIKSFNPATGLVTVFEALSSTISAGNGITVTAGCDKACATCKVKFDNVINFQGFPQLPGRDSLAKGPT